MLVPCGRWAAQQTRSVSACPISNLCLGIKSQMELFQSGGLGTGSLAAMDKVKHAAAAPDYLARGAWVLSRKSWSVQGWSGRIYSAHQPIFTGFQVGVDVTTETVIADTRAAMELGYASRSVFCVTAYCILACVGRYNAVSTKFCRVFGFSMGSSPLPCYSAVERMPLGFCL
jgi:hypothetical protein